MKSSNKNIYNYYLIKQNGISKFIWNPHTLTFFEWDQIGKLQQVSGFEVVNFFKNNKDTTIEKG